jgi:predicted Rossmann fold flavoprotein
MSRVVVVGAGAAGIMAAIFAATHGAETLLLERTRDGGRKILISGGGRCNILPSALDESRFVTESSPNTLRKIVRSWPLHDQIAFFERDAGIPLVEEPESAKLFPRSQSGRDVRDRLIGLARARGVTVVSNVVVTSLVPQWQVVQQHGPAFEADAVVLATGGLSVPSTGSDGIGLQIVDRLGYAINHTYAALTPLTGTAFAQLAGISLPVVLSARAEHLNANARGGFLFTHGGYSGPAVLDVSHVAVRSKDTAKRARLIARWTPLDDAGWEAALQPAGTRSVLSTVASHLPVRLAEALLDCSAVDRRRTLSQLTRAERRRLIDTLVRCELPWTGDEGYKKAEVTGGGVALSEIDPRTMESRRHTRLFLCGEMLDAFGPIGGYNFLWAWVTGRAAGIHAAAARA